MGDDTWTAKEVFSDLKTDLVQHLNKQDTVLTRIDRRLDDTMTKADGREIHERIDAIDRRTTKLEDERDADIIAATALGGRRDRIAKRAAWILAAVVVPLTTALILVFVHH